MFGSLGVVTGSVDGVEAPLGVARRRPRFGWQLASGVRGARQSAYRLVVRASDTGHGADGAIWDSGVIASDQTQDVVVADGPDLRSRTAYTWSVQVWDEAGAMSTSPVWTFETAVFDDAGWSAHWIGAARTGRPDDPGTPRLRTTFAPIGEVVRARLRITALGFSDARINGQAVTADRFTPAWTDYSVRVRYRTYDVTTLLREGVNALAVQLAPGYYAGWIPAPIGRSRYYGSQPWLFAELSLDLADGRQQVIVSDGSWRAAPSEITEADVFHGESQDARLIEFGWDLPDHDDSGWTAVVVDDSVVGAAVLDSQISPAVRVAGELPVLDLTEPAPGRFVVDFGQNIAGWLRLRVAGPAGTTVTVRHGEVLNPDGTVYTHNLREARATDRFTLAGTGSVETFEPLFTYHGFRYAEISGLPGPLATDALTAVVAHADLPGTTVLRTSDPLLDALQQALKWTLDNDMWSYPTDCHQRDERLPWISMDMVGFARTMVANVAGEAYYRDWLRTVADAQLPSGGFPDIAVGIEMGEAAPGASELAVVLASAIWQEYGTTGAITDHWDAIRRYLGYAEQTAPDGLSSRLGWIDWISVGEETDRGVTSQAFYARACQLAAGMAEVTGQPEAAHYRELASRAAERFVENYVDEEGRVRGDTQTAYVLALAFDLVPDDLRATLAGHLVANIEARGMHLATGFVGTHDLLSVLTDTGHTDVAYALIRQTDYPSWGYMIERGATTLWERWDSIHPDGSYAEQDPPVAGMNSFNHYGYGGFGRWLIEVIGGLVPHADAPGYRRFTLRPQPGGGLTHAELSHETPHGRIVCAWRLTGDRFDLHAEVPANTAATVWLPDGAIHEVGSGSYDFSALVADS